MSIKYIDIIHHSHTDFGFTDHPMIARRLQAQYVGQAMELALKDPDFYWTAETVVPVADWWQDTGEQDHSKLLSVLNAGKLDICGMAFNTTAFHTSAEWDRILNWMPRELEEQWSPKSIMQNDVNGMPQKAVACALDKGMDSLWIGPNTYNAIPPCPTPSAFYWQIPGGRKMFVWLNSGYCDGYFLFNENWRIGPVPAVSDLRYRAPVKGDIWKADKESVFRMHERCLQTIKLLEGGSIDAEVDSRDGFTQNKIYGGYPYERLLVSVTNNYRIDNDPPFGGIADFVRKWGELGLEPKLRMTTATEAMNHLEMENKEKIPVKAGEWVDWWANGTASAPVELAIGRKASVILKSVDFLAHEALTVQQQADYDEAVNQLCMFHEHTYGSWESVASPYSINTRMMEAEKNIFAYRALVLAENLIADILRNSEGTEGEICLVNPAHYEKSAWISLPVHCLRGEYAGVEDQQNHKFYPFYMKEGASNFKRPESEEHFSRENISRTFSDLVPCQVVKFWADKLKPHSRRAYRLVKVQKEKQVYRTDWDVLPSCPVGGEDDWLIKLDDKKWPKQVMWKGSPIMKGEFGRFLSCSPKGFAPRWILKDIFMEDDTACRRKMRNNSLETINAVMEEAFLAENNEHTVIYSQDFSHPSLLWGQRKLTFFKKEGMLRLNIKINRKSSFDPEVFYLEFTSPIKSVPYLYNADIPFIPGDGQLEGSCMDFYATDGFALYQREGKGWLWNSRDAALVSLGGPHLSERTESMTEYPQRLLSMIFDNTWDTNFVCNNSGIMEFQYDVLGGGEFTMGEIPDIIHSMNQEPVTIIGV